MNWYPFYTGDYNRKTAHLSLLEHGALRRLIDHYMATGLPLPADSAKLFRICGARSPQERRSVTLVAEEFFTKEESLLRNGRCDREICKQLKLRESQSAKAKLRHSKGKADDTADALPQDSHGSAGSIPATVVVVVPIQEEESIGGTRIGVRGENPFEEVA